MTSNIPVPESSASPSPSQVQREAPTHSELTVEQKSAANLWDHVDDVLPIIELARAGKWSPYENMGCKYIELRIDMRDGGCIIKNAKGERINPADLRRQHNGTEQWLPWETEPRPLSEWQRDAIASTADSWMESFPSAALAATPTASQSDLPRLVYEAIGAASMCWKGGTGASEFDSELATTVADKLIADIRALATRDSGQAPASQKSLGERATSRTGDDLPPALRDVAAERVRQDQKWGGVAHDDHHTVAEWVQLIEDYAGWARVMAGMDSPDKARRRLIQVAALAVAAVESMDRAAGVAIPGKEQR